MGGSQERAGTGTGPDRRAESRNGRMGRPGFSACLLSLNVWFAPVGLADIPACERELTQFQARAWRVDDGLPLDSVYALAQDRDGFIWIGTEEGLTRFDGVSFDYVDLGGAVAPSPKFITSLALDANARMLIGTGSAGVLAASNGQVEQLSGFGSGYIEENGLVVGPDGSAWVAVPGHGLIELQGRSTTSLGTSSGLAGATVTAMAVRADGGLWIGMEDEGIQFYDQGQVHDPGLPEALAGVYVEALLEASDGALWVGSREGLFRYHEGELIRFGPAEGLSEAFIKDILEDDAGRIWVGTGGAGVGRLCGNEFQMLGEEQGAPIGLVRDMMQDTEGAIWLATGSDGIVQLRRGAALPLTASEGLPDAPILPILQARDGAAWIGTFGGGLVHWLDGEVTTLTRADGLSDDRVLALASAPNGDLWVGTRAGLDRIRAFQVVESFREELPHPTVPSLFHDGEALWIGTIAGVAKFQQGAVHPVFPGDGSYGGPIVQFFRSAAGELWISSDGGGVYRLIEGVPERVGVDVNMAFAFLDDGSGGVWIATTAGLVHWDGERELRLTREQGLPSSQFFSMLPDSDGGLWLSSNVGVTRVVMDDLETMASGGERRIRFRHFDESDGMPKAETNGGFQPAALRDRRGRHWYPTSEGVAIFDPSSLGEVPVPPLPVITRVVSETITAENAERVDLPANPEFTEVSYTVPTFRNPDRLGFRYRLVGYDSEWYLAGPDRTAIYRKLPPGQFEFEVQARQPNGPWSDSRSMVLVVDRTFYESPWFWLTLVVLAALLLWMVVARETWRRAKIRERRQQAQKLEAIGMLSSGIAHDFNNILAAITGSTDVLLETLPEDSPLRRYADSVRRAATEGEKLTRQLLAFGQKQTSELRWVDLSSELSNLRTLLSPLLPGNIEFRMDVQRDVGQCRIDPVHVQQVILNLVINARDALPDGGRIDVSLVQKAPEYSVDSTAQGRSKGFACIVVEDTGTGMDAETRSRIFEPFFSTKPAGMGTGLGMAVIYGIVKEAGGTIDVRSRPGNGTAVYVYFPVSPRPDAVNTGSRDA